MWSRRKRTQQTVSPLSVYACVPLHIACCITTCLRFSFSRFFLLSWTNKKETFISMFLCVFFSVFNPLRLFVVDIIVAQPLPLLLQIALRSTHTHIHCANSWFVCRNMSRNTLTWFVCANHFNIPHSHWVCISCKTRQWCEQNALEFSTYRLNCRLFFSSF